MNFNAPLLKPIRILLFPFSLLYALIIKWRNYFYNKGYFNTTTFNLPILCVGNLSVGGTGKSTMVEYLIHVLQPHYNLAVLSRGYKRKTKGYALAGKHTTALEIGDEPMQFHKKFPTLVVAVGEQRLEAIPMLLQDRPDTDIIILDDAFQHRSVKAGFNLLLTEYKNLYTRDWFLPTGDLRDQTSSAERADIILVTKSPATLTTEEANDIKTELNPLAHQSVYFSTLVYGQPYHLITGEALDILPTDEVLLVTGIANPVPLKDFLLEHTYTYYELLYSDHHIFSIDDLNEITERFHYISAKQKMIITTEKDAVRLLKFSDQLVGIPIYVIPVSMKILFGAAPAFHEKVISYINSHPKSLS